MQKLISIWLVVQVYLMSKRFIMWLVSVHAEGRQTRVKSTVIKRTESLLWCHFHVQKLDQNDTLVCFLSEEKRVHYQNKIIIRIEASFMLNWSLRIILFLLKNYLKNLKIYSLWQIKPWFFSFFILNPHFISHDNLNIQFISIKKSLMKNIFLVVITSIPLF